MLVHKKCTLMCDLDGVVFNVTALIRAAVWRMLGVMVKGDDFAPAVHGAKELEKMIRRRAQEEGRSCFSEHIAGIFNQLRTWRNGLEMVGLYESMWEGLVTWNKACLPLTFVTSRGDDDHVLENTTAQLYWLGLLKGVSSCQLGRDKLEVLEELISEGRPVVVIEDDPHEVMRLASIGRATIIVPEQPWNEVLVGKDLHDVHRMHHGDVAQLLVQATVSS